MITHRKANCISDCIMHNFPLLILICIRCVHLCMPKDEIACIQLKQHLPRRDFRVVSKHIKLEKAKASQRIEHCDKELMYLALYMLLRHILKEN